MSGGLASVPASDGLATVPPDKESGSESGSESGKSGKSDKPDTGAGGMESDDEPLAQGVQQALHLPVPVGYAYTYTTERINARFIRQMLATPAVRRCVLGNWLRLFDV